MMHQCQADATELCFIADSQPSNDLLIYPH